MSLLLLACLTSAHALPPPSEDVAGQAFSAAVHRMRTVADTIQDARFTFERQEWIGGKMSARTVAAVSLAYPHKVYLEYVGELHQGRKVLWWADGWNEGRMRVDPGPMMPILNLDPEGRLAMRDSHYSIRQMSIKRIVDLIVKDALKVRDHPTWLPSIEDLGPQSIAGEPSRCFMTSLPKAEDPSFYAYRSRICVNTASGLPNQLQVWDLVDGEVRLYEDYSWLGLELNQGLDEAFFEPETHGL